MGGYTARTYLLIHLLFMVKDIDSYTHLLAVRVKIIAVTYYQTYPAYFESPDQFFLICVIMVSSL